MEFIDILTILSFVALTADVLLQARNIKHTHSVNDISLIGLSIRYTAIVVILFKFYTLQELPLFFGQLLFVMAFSCYFFLALYYYRHKLPAIKK